MQQNSRPLADFSGYQLLFFLALFFLIPPKKTFAQDTTYYESYKNYLTTRLYTSRKYTALTVLDKFDDSRWRFEPNSNLNLGVGATYNDVTLNIGLGFGFMNPERGRGDTKMLDLQAHIYPKNFVIDLFAQFYTGYYLRRLDDEIFTLNPVLYPDLTVRMFGANFQYLFNGDKLSMKAAFLQSARQKKSAGSLLAGFEAFGGFADNRGLFFPEDRVPLNRNFSRLGFFQLGPNAGYVHTLVFLKHFFITGMVSANLDLGKNYLDMAERRDFRWSAQPNFFARGFLGYNSPKWSINANYVRSYVRMSTVDDFNPAFITGNYRINLIYRFLPGLKLQRYLDYVEPSRYLPSKWRQKTKN
ncbi:DUF4421 domain-containing protein [Cecembia calidifontis]|uniref:Uncharacterized protein DUF4421 n=1 Tax=Cecembia calidifontis TaxID=1187080 RepID=A0A4Q7P4C1_9BACT|nr:DUF4421 domain-containing protein [Cecembia calidifontis]RZS94507.1 uncharacterized protein DUF4421 [Cecembia calidifontis]